MATIDRVADYKVTLERVTKKDEALVIIIGVDRGYPLDALHRLSKTTRVLAIEPFPLAAEAVYARADFRAWIRSGRLTFLVGPEYDGASDAWRNIRLTDETARVPLIVATDMEKRFPLETDSARVLATRVVADARRDVLARKRLAGRYLLNTLTNIPAIAREGDVSSLACAWTNVPAVVIGAGPSLDRNLEDLRRVQGRVLMIAVDTAVQPLLAAGLRPHLVVSIDRGTGSARYLRDLPDTRGMWLVAEGGVDPMVLDQFTGRTFIFTAVPDHPWPWLAGCGVAREQLQSWGSVLTTAFDLARVAACDPIVLLGADLAYTDDALYCRNAVCEPEWEHLPTAARTKAFTSFLAQTPHSSEAGIGTASVVTDPSLVALRDWMVKQSLTGRPQIVNGTGAGILLGGRIIQAALPSLSLPLSGGGNAGIRTRLEGMWSRGCELRPAVEGRLLDALNSGPALPKQVWLDFVGQGTTTAQIDACVASAVDGLRLRERTSSYLAVQRSRYDRRAATLEGAREASHPHFSQGLLTAPALQAHVLLDFLQRTYALDTPGGVTDVLRAVSTLPTAVRALDFGCGVGRTMKPLMVAGVRVDGVDISEGMLEFARLHPALTGCEFYQSKGNDCGGAPEGAYDLVYSHLCFQYISSRAIRKDVLRAMARLLRPGGVVVIQIGFHQGRQASALGLPHVPWSADALDATDGDAERDVWATPDELHLIAADFTRHFRDVRFQFLDVPNWSDLPGQLIVSGATSIGLAARLDTPGDTAQ